MARWLVCEGRLDREARERGGLCEGGRVATVRMFATEKARAERNGTGSCDGAARRRGCSLGGGEALGPDAQSLGCIFPVEREIVPVWKANGQAARSLERIFAT